ITKQIEGACSAVVCFVSVWPSSTTLSSSPSRCMVSPSRTSGATNCDGTWPGKRGSQKDCSRLRLMGPQSNRLFRPRSKQCTLAYSVGWERLERVGGFRRSSLFRAHRCFMGPEPIGHFRPKPEKYAPAYPLEWKRLGNLVGFGRDADVGSRLHFLGAEPNRLLRARPRQRALAHPVWPTLTQAAAQKRGSWK